MTLTEFLTARLDEDGATARDALRGPASEPWRQHQYDYVVQRGHYNATEMRDMPIAHCGAMGFKLARHIARHDPARVLADVDAKRRIVEAAQSAVDAATGLIAYEPIAFAMLGTLSLLALPYADHPDYDEAWRP